MTKTKGIFSPKHATPLLFPTSVHTFIFQLLRRKPFLFLLHLTSNISSANRISFLAALGVLPVPLVHLVQAIVIFFLDLCIGPCLSASTLAALRCNLHMVARAMLLKHEAVCQSFTENSNLLNVQYSSLAPGCFSDLICYSHHSPCHTGFCLLFCSSDVPSTLQTQDICIFKSLCWNVLLSSHMVCSSTLQVFT